MRCASNFKKLMDYEYYFSIGRKGKLKEITLGFSDTDFHHLAGLHKLKDIHIARANRSNLFQQILDGRITYNTLTKSQFLPEIQSRLETLPKLESLLDENQLIFRYNVEASFQWSGQIIRKDRCSTLFSKKKNIT